MNPKTAQSWLEAKAWLDSHPSAPRILAQEVAKRAGVALRKAKPFRAATRLPRALKTKTAKTAIPKLKKELDRVFSIFIRRRDASPYSDLGKCCTCTHVAHWREMDCGHYAPRQDLATRWDERNCHLQDKSCNGFRGGEPEKMAAYIDAKYGAGTAASLRAQARQPFRLNRQWLEQKIAHYKVLIGEVKA